MKKDPSRGAFPYPIGIALFNRPVYHERLLSDLANQTMTIELHQLVIHIESYVDSRYQELGIEDKTARTLELSHRYFPHAKTFTPEVNQGIPRSLTYLEDYLFSTSSASWALIIEGDMALSPQALEVIAQSIESCSKRKSIAIINFDFADWNHSSNKFRYHRGHGTRLYAISRKHYIERKPAVAAFNALLESTKYADITHEQVLKALAPLGIYPSNRLQDAMRSATAVAFRKLQVVPQINIAHHIGEFGHSNSQIGQEFSVPENLTFPALVHQNTRISRLNIALIFISQLIARVRVFYRLPKRIKKLLIRSILH